MLVEKLRCCPGHYHIWCSASNILKHSINVRLNNNISNVELRVICVFYRHWCSKMLVEKLRCCPGHYHIWCSASNILKHSINVRLNNNISNVELRVICVFYRHWCSKMLIEKLRCCPGHYHIWCSASNILKHSINVRLNNNISNVELRVICVFYRHWCSKMLVEKLRCCPGHYHIWCSASNILKHSINVRLNNNISNVELRVICVFYRHWCSKMLVEKLRCCPGHCHIWCSASNVLKHSINVRINNNVSNVELRVICVFYRHWCSKMLVEKLRCCPGHCHIWCSASNDLKHSINVRINNNVSNVELRVICVFYRHWCSKMLVEKLRCCPGHCHIWCSASNVLKHSINVRLNNNVSNVELRVIGVFYRHWCSKMLVEKIRCCPGHNHIWCSASNVLKHSKCLIK